MHPDEPTGPAQTGGPDDRLRARRRAYFVIASDSEAIQRQRPGFPFTQSGLRLLLQSGAARFPRWISGQEYILEELKAMRISIERLARPSESLGIRAKSSPSRRHLLKFTPPPRKTQQAIEEYLLENDAVEDYSLNKTEKHMELQIDIVSSAPREIDNQITDKIVDLVSRQPA
jgi:hypothetical protein